MRPSLLRPSLRPLAAAVCAASIATSCSTTLVRSGPDRPSESTLFHGGRIRLDAWSEPVEALLVRDGRVVAAGDAQALAASVRGTLWWVDLEGGVAVPGLQDAHGHVENLGAALENVDLIGAASYAEVVERIAERAATLPADTWIGGRGWDQTLWTPAEFPHHEELSRRVPDHPVFVQRVDGHAALANRSALAAAGLDPPPAELPAVEGGTIHVDDRGHPSGVLVDNAMDLVAGRRPLPDRATRRRRLLAAHDELVSLGLVAVHDMGLSPEAVELVRGLELEGRWKLRLLAYLWANDGLSSEVLARYPGPRDQIAAAAVRVVGAKLMLDGAMGSRGAALLEDYADAPGERGHLVVGPERFGQLARQVAEAGLQPATHAIGDRANRILLDTYTEMLERDHGLRALRPRVEHAQLVAREDWERFEAAGVVPSMQPTHATSDMRWAETRVGPERLLGAYAWKRLRGPRARLALGSDFPVESPDPRLGLYAARTRQDADGQPAGGWLPDQRLDARETLDGFTAGAAHAVCEEARRGALRPGFFADMSVFDRDPIEATPAELLEARVRMTVIQGEVVYRAED